MNAVLPSDVDAECVPLSEALNTLPGIQTIESCAGHGTKPYRIWFFADHLDNLPAVAWSLDACHSGCEGWRLIASTDCAMQPIRFRVEGPRGKRAYSGAERIAELIRREFSPATV